MPPSAASYFGGWTMDVGRDKNKNTAWLQNASGLFDYLERLGRVLDEVNQSDRRAGTFRKINVFKSSLPHFEPIFFCCHLDGPGAWFNPVGLPSAPPGEVKKNSCGRTHIEKKAPGGQECFEAAQDRDKVPRPASRFGLIIWVLDLAVKRADKSRRGTGVGEEVAAVEAQAEVPNFAVLAVRNFDLLFAQTSSISSFFIRPETLARAGGAGSQFQKQGFGSFLFSGRADA